MSPKKLPQSVREKITDDATQIFFSEELRAIEREREEIDFPEHMGRQLFPFDFNYPNGTTSIMYYTVEKVGMAQWIANAASDIPRSTIKRTRNFSQVRTMASSYAWTLDDIEAAQMAGLPLDRDLSDAAMLAIAQFENGALWNGDDEYNIGGFLSNANIPTYTVTADGAGALTTWVSKTPAQIIRDVGFLLSQIRTNTKNIEKADTVLLPIAQYELIARTPFNQNSAVTILQFLLGNNPGLQIFSVLEMDSDENDVFATDVMVAYKRDPKKVKVAVPVDRESRPVQAKGLEFEVILREKFGGVIVKKPLSVNIGEGI